MKVETEKLPMKKVEVRKRSKKISGGRVPNKLAFPLSEESGESLETSGDISLISEGNDESIPETFMSLGNALHSTEVTYTSVPMSSVFADPKDNPLITLNKSNSFLNITKLDFQTDLLTRIGQVIPLVVIEVEDMRYRYIGALETYISVTEYLKKNDINKVWVVIIPFGTNEEEITKTWAEINMSETIPNSLHRLTMNRYLLKEKGLTRTELKKYTLGKPNGKESKKIDRDFSICTSDIIFKLVTGIDSDKFSKPSTMKAKISYTQAIAVAQLLGNSKEKQEEFEEKLNVWLKSAREFEFEADISKPLVERSWYINSKPTEIARGIVGKNNLPLKYVSSHENTWDVRSIDENIRVVSLPAISIDLKAKTDADIQKLIEVSIKAEAIYLTLNSYLKIICPVDHGGQIRGKAADDDSSLENRANFSEFYNHNYIKKIFIRRTLHYVNIHGFLKSLGLNMSVFGYSSFAETKKLSVIREKFEIWQALNSDRFLYPDSLPNSRKDVLSTPNILNTLSESIDKHLPLDSEIEKDFGTFFHLIFSIVFKNIQKEFDASLASIDYEKY